MDVESVRKLIADSKQLVEINTLKVEYENFLKELTQFQNFVTVCRKDKSKSSVLDCSIEIRPLLTDEEVVVTITNKSPAFHFDPRYWTFSLVINGTQVTTWAFESRLQYGQSQTFSATLDSSDFVPQLVTIRVTFSISWKKQEYVQVFQLGKEIIDVLHYLSPTRRLPIGTSLSRNLESPYDTLDPNRRVDVSRSSIKPTCKIVFVGGSTKQGFFPAVLFKDSCHRGFSDEVYVNGFTIVANKPDSPNETMQPCVNELNFYVNGHEVTVSLSSSSVYNFECSNPKLLVALKAAMLRRIFCLENLQIQSLVGDKCDALFHLTLKLEKAQVDKSQKMDLISAYMELRRISESMKFSNVSCVELN